MRLFITLLLAGLLLASAAFAPRGQRAAGTGGAAAADAARDQKVAAAAESLRGRLVETRRDLHMHPELSNREERTSRVVAERLRALGLTDVKTGVAKHGVTALLVGGRPGPVVAVRADMDALPIEEVNDKPFKSQTPGVMHACGHDVHTTVELGVAEVLSKMRDEVRGTVKFLFQPAEEGAPPGEEGGAKLMIKEGAFDNPRPQAIFGLHTLPAIEAGQVGYHFGPAMASSDRFTIVVRGRSSHGAQPQNGIDSVVVAAECVAALQNIRSRRIDPLEPLVITVGTIQGGDRFNVIAGQVKMSGTMRTFNDQVRERAVALMRETLQSVTAAYGATYELEMGDGNAVTYNEPALVEETLPTIRRVVGAGNALAIKPFMPAEDFSAYQKLSPGFFFFLGVGNREKGITAGWHTQGFDVDEESLVVGVKVMSNVVLDYLERHAGAARAGGRAMTHVVLLGDSIFDNAAYVRGGADVLTHLRRLAPEGWGATLLAVDGSVVEGVHAQLGRVPAGATHLVVSAGGNDALLHSNILGERAGSSAEVLGRLADVAEGFEAGYRRMLEAVRSAGRPAAVCTVYYPRLPDPLAQRLAVTALTVFNDAIIRAAFSAGVPLVDLRLVCDEDEDYANPIEPSEAGGAKIAGAIVRLVSEHDFGNGRTEVFV